jgi:hypothetical protein
MTPSQQLRDSAQRITAGEWTDSDLQAVARAVLALPADDDKPVDIAARLKKPEWVTEGDYSECETILGRCYVRKHSTCDHWWWFCFGGYRHRCETLAEGQAACEADFTRRVLEAFEVKEQASE